MALNLTVQSYVDNLDFGLTADRRAVPDIDVLADLLQVSFDELAAAVAARQPPEPAAPPAEAKPDDSSVVALRGKKRAHA
jgi:hypothetical protein